MIICLSTQITERHGTAMYYPRLPPPHFANHIANFEGHIDVCAFWYNFTIKYILNIKRNLLYIFWNVCAFWYNFTIKYIPNI